jgi:hypothetical protein
MKPAGTRPRERADNANVEFVVNSTAATGDLLPALARLLIAVAQQSRQAGRDTSPNDPGKIQHD